MLTSFTRRRCAAVAVVCFAFTAPGSVQAQTAPQLIPYTSMLVAGGGTQTTAAGGTCPSSGYTATDAYGDGCLAVEIEIGNAAASAVGGARSAVADTAGNVFFTDYVAGLVRRVDAVSGVVTAVAGGASASPSAGTATCGGVSIDARGDGCAAGKVHLSHPAALAFAPNGDLYFTDAGQYDVRHITAVNGLIPADGSGLISNVAGYAAGSASYGFVISNATTAINAATQSYLDAPFGLAFDKQGDLFIAEEYKNAVVVVNTNLTGSTSVNGVTVPAGQIVKVAGASTSAGSTCPNGTSGTYGCNYNAYTEGAEANSTFLDSPYGVAVDPTGNVYIANEYNNVVPVVSPAGVLTTFTGNQAGKSTKSTARGTASSSFLIGSPFGIATDAAANVYFTDALNGVVWRVDAGTKSQYVVAGGGTVCPTAQDSHGDGCKATQTTFGASGSTYATASNPGIFGVNVGPYGNLYVGDTITNLVREVATGAQFGPTGAGGTTNILDVRFGVGDGPAASGFTLTSGASNFALGTPTFVSNPDGTVDYLLPVTATPSQLGAFAGTLQVTSTKGATASFPLSGIYVQSPTTRTAVTAVPSGTPCTNATSISTSTAVVITAAITATGSPTGTVTFFANGTQIGTPQTVNGNQATLSYTFAAVGTYAITATYSGDTYYKASTGTAATSIVTSTPSYTTTMNAGQVSTVKAGGTGLYSFTVAQNLYSGTLAFSCAGLPAGAQCVFSPATLTGTGCSQNSTVALSITTTQPVPTQTAGFAGRRGGWLLGAIAVLLAASLGLRRRRVAASLGGLALLLMLLVASTGLAGCGKSGGITGTPAGTSTITVTTTPSTGAATSFQVSLTVQ